MQSYLFRNDQNNRRKTRMRWNEYAMNKKVKFNIRTNAQFKSEVKEAAAKQGLNVSEYAHDALLRAMQHAKWLDLQRQRGRSSKPQNRAVSDETSFCCAYCPYVDNSAENGAGSSIGEYGGGDGA